jgi:hypothetical protein
MVSLVAIGPVVIVAFARNSIGASIVVVGSVTGLVVAITTDALLLALGVFSLLWLVAIGFLIFGSPRPAPR